ncbi:helix-turn-helix domain-containing protein [Frankia sp. CNm7]|uniref:Helix-turn-helix domain-containing protein n=1 Tax=Frankia nepalensis TaxID=1836974 RepID=A0A937RDW1_9ACTN|nr:helix-turn-helix domain-containing protein [Frankia nepalensis]MBL7498834.1 helix-turn-helix domain-containing protein [Frankia nepalensis]MBL7508639.1 helix-turn-helix domain-containing protein [Frankia nepalensis]MBL7518909.1 helix-turn-helix domain-containing protein [Frankia nepalensis]MBL7628447.1 helix-turn-helix domain-containing protein [Frankia nepalensis]
MTRPSPQTERLLDLVDLLAARPGDGYTLADIARAVGVDKATIHPMVVALARRGWLLRHPRRHTYRLGPALVAAGRAAARGHPVVEAARPVVREIAEATGLMCLALVAGAIPGEHDDLLVAEIGRPAARGAAGPAAEHALTAYNGLRLGQRISPQPPLGAVCVAWADDAAVERWLARLGPDRPPDALARVTPGLAGVRSRGWALEVENRMRERLGTLAAELGEDQRHAEQAATLRRVIGEIGGMFDLADTLPATIDPAAGYRASAVNAPVFDSDGTVVVILCLVCAAGDGMPARAGAEILALGERVRRAADALTAATHGRPPASRQP